MIYAEVYEYCADADLAFKAFSFGRMEDKTLTRAVRKPCCSFAEVGGDQYYFMGRAVYERWNKGRTYILDGVLHRSGCPLERPQEGEVDEHIHRGR